MNSGVPPYSGIGRNGSISVENTRWLAPVHGDLARFLNLLLVYVAHIKEDSHDSAINFLNDANNLSGNLNSSTNITLNQEFYNASSFDYQFLMQWFEDILAPLPQECSNEQLEQVAESFDLLLQTLTADSIMSYKMQNMVEGFDELRKPLFKLYDRPSSFENEGSSYEHPIYKNIHKTEREVLDFQKYQLSILANYDPYDGPHAEEGAITKIKKSLDYFQQNSLTKRDINFLSNLGINGDNFIREVDSFVRAVDNHLYFLEDQDQTKSDSHHLAKARDREKARGDIHKVLHGFHRYICNFAKYFSSEQNKNKYTEETQTQAQDPESERNYHQSKLQAQQSISGGNKFGTEFSEIHTELTSFMSENASNSGEDSNNKFFELVDSLPTDSINAQNSYGETLLNLAVFHGRLDWVRELLERGADPNISNDEGKTALDWAKHTNHQMIAEFLTIS